jgi:hypothetical protein
MTQEQIPNDDDTENSDDGTDAEDELARIADGADTDIEDVRARYKTQREYGVPRDEALRTVSRAVGVTSKSYSGDDSDDETTRVGKLERDSWTTLEVRVVGAWEPQSPKVAQKAHLADESGLVAAVAWAKSEVPTLEVGESYRLTDVRIDKDEYTAEEYDIKRLQASLNSQTRVEGIDDVDVLDGLEPAEADA